MKRAKCYIELEVGDAGTDGEEGGRDGIHLPEAGESRAQAKYPSPDCQKHELSPSLHQYYFQTLSISRPFEELASFSALTIKWFKQGNLYQPLQKVFVFPKWFCSLLI